MRPRVTATLVLRGNARARKRKEGEAVEETECDPGPVPEERGELSDQEYANLHNTIDVMHFIFTQMLQDLPASGSVDMMYAPFQPLVRAVMIAAVAYYRDNDSPELAERARALLDSGKLDSAGT